MRDSLIIREANPEEADCLSQLAQRSKAYWGYSDAFMEACRAELTVLPGMILDARFHFVVLEMHGEIVGFYGIESLSPNQFELDALFLDPQQIGSGLGRILMSHARNYVARAGGGILLIQSDPNAEGFYRAVGARSIGETESASVPGRWMPMLEITICADEDARSGPSNTCGCV